MSSSKVLDASAPGAAPAASPAAAGPAPARSREERLRSTFMTSVIAAIGVAAIYFGQPVLVPLALAILIAFALSPLVMALRKIGLGRVPSVLVSVVFAVLAMMALGIFIGSQAAKLAADLPHYQTNLAKKIQSIRGAATSNSVVRGATAVFNNLGNEITGPPLGPERAPANGKKAPREPVPVQIERQRTTPIDIVENVAGPLLGPLVTMSLVIVFVGFILLQKEDLRDRFIRLAGQDLQRTTLALDEAADRLSHYLFSQTSINVSFGILVGIGLWLIGIPNPGLWGLLAGMLRFVPYVGVPLAALFPLGLALAIDPGWSKVVWTLVLYFGLESITGQLIEPVVYGRNMGLSAVAVVAAAVFWIWLWGPVGLLLSTPLTMCLVVMGRHIEPLQFLDVLLGDRPPLAVEESLYLRMLAGDPDTAALEAEAFLRNNSPIEYFDEVTIKALALAQRDFDRGVLTNERLQQIRETVDALIENLAERGEIPEGLEAAEEGATGGIAPAPGEEEIAEGWRGQAVWCVAGRTALDEAAAALLAHLVEKRGLNARVLSAAEVSPANLARLDTTRVQAICVSYLDPGNYKNARYLIRRLKKRMPDARFIAAFWGYAQSDSHYLDSLEAMGMEEVVSSLGQAVDRISVLARKAQAPPAKEPEAAA